MQSGIGFLVKYSSQKLLKDKTCELRGPRIADSCKLRMKKMDEDNLLSILEIAEGTAHRIRLQMLRRIALVARLREHGVE